jgi:hypothetical protein
MAHILEIDMREYGTLGGVCNSTRLNAHIGALDDLGGALRGTLWWSTRRLWIATRDTAQ